MLQTLFETVKANKAEVIKKTAIVTGVLVGIALVYVGIKNSGVSASEITGEVVDAVAQDIPVA